MPASILVVDDHDWFRGTVKRFLQSELAGRVVEDAPDGEEALRIARSAPPDLVLMDITMPKLNGLEATRRLKAERPHTKVIILTMHNEEAYRQAAQECGADAYLLKDAIIADLLPTIRRLIGGDVVENG